MLAVLAHLGAAAAMAAPAKGRAPAPLGAWAKAKGPPKPAKRSGTSEKTGPKGLARAEAGKSNGDKGADKRAREPRGGRGKGKGVSAREASPPVPPARGKVVLFGFEGDGGGVVARQVGRALRAKGLKVATHIRPVDSAEQYREMAAALNVAGYLHGEVRGDGDEARATVHLRSGVSGQRVASATFSGERRKLPGEVGKTLWGRMGSDLARVCAQATKPRRVRAPMRIEAGTPLPDPPREDEPSHATTAAQPDPWAADD